jgi:aspartyl-tRNA(Asn)/glutamyl-tRNA(Gln) amidotransferase subunit A
MKSQPKMDDLTQLSLNDAAGLLRSGNLSPVAYLTSFLERIDQYNHALDAFIAIDRERSLLEASKAEREIAQGGWRGPLHGVPVALKDIVDVAGQRTSAH